MREGGSYIVREDGTEERVEGTTPHPDGNAARTPDGQVIDGPMPIPVAEAPPTPTSPPPAKKRDAPKEEQ